MKELTAKNVNEVFFDCLWKDADVESLSREEIMAKSKIVEGVVSKVGFDPERLIANTEVIGELLSQLPAGFKEGWSFLEGCMTKDGELWGQHQDVEQLMMLGMGVEKVVLCSPRELWPLLPGNVPYYQTK